MFGEPDPGRWGHKNVHLLNLTNPDDETTLTNTPQRPIASTDLDGDAQSLSALLSIFGLEKSTTYPIAQFGSQWVAPKCKEDENGNVDDEGPCREFALTPYALFEKLDKWRDGHEKERQAVIGGHGTTWAVGGYVDWKNTYNQGNWAPYNPADDSGYETYLEVFSKHGNSEQYVDLPSSFVMHYSDFPTNQVPADDGTPSDEACPPTDVKDHVEGCMCRQQQPGERHKACCEVCYDWVKEHYCNKLPGPLCDKAAERALKGGAKICDELLFSERDLPGLDWGECDQCPASGRLFNEGGGDAPKPLCWRPANGYFPGGSVQAGLATKLEPGCKTYKNKDGDSCHPAKDATCACTEEFPNDDSKAYMDVGFIAATDTHHARPGSVYDENRHFAEVIEGKAYSFGSSLISEFSSTTQQRSYWYTGGIAAVHLPAEQDGNLREEIFKAFQRREIYATSGPRMKLWFYLTNPTSGDEAAMGTSHKGFSGTPKFRVRVVGAPSSNGNCDKVSDSYGLGGKLFVAGVCHDHCYNVDVDDRLAIDKIEVVRIERGTGDIAKAISVTVHECDAAESKSEDGCVIAFDGEAMGSTPVLYYVRALQEPTDAFNADTVRCEEYDANDACVKSKPCESSSGGGEYDCQAEGQERAWSSPIFLYP